MTEKINHPDHYQGDRYECIDVIKEMTKRLPGDAGFLVGNIIKYLWRLGRKPGEDSLYDVKKAQWYLNCLIEQMEEIDEEILKGDMEKMETGSEQQWK